MSDEQRDIISSFKKRLEKLEIQIAEIDRNVSEILQIVRRREEEN
ncbi:hypothetical protein EV210_101375 [Anaerospora hongkongensis]|uniref:Uncharacterized protein n=1 Tax=Anaerospora hongkongensis TaxID=244830 RepID=A0A4R1Q4Z4_9FIRM|nr:hypothetical protein [Anaerospora hongkongensis]TCL40174.1 hypothetical protein EV210_101375 [Anaerospora hongkongensis]